jgi:hypothetical protein
MAYLDGPPLPYRWQLGLLLLSLPRRLIARGFRDLPTRGADNALPIPASTQMGPAFRSSWVLSIDRTLRIGPRIGGEPKLAGLEGA